LLVKVPLHLDSVSAGLADQRVGPAEAAKGVVGKLIPAGIALDGDVFHVCIVVYRARKARENVEKVGRVNPCCITTYGGAGAPAKMAGSLHKLVHNPKVRIPSISPEGIVRVNIDLPILVTFFYICLSRSNSTLLVLIQTDQTLTFVANFTPETIYLIHQNSPT
jgi:hypothetical protein